MESAPQKAQIDDKYIIIKKLSYGGQANIFLIREKYSDKVYVAKVPIEEGDSFLTSEIQILKYLKDNQTPYIINIVNNGNGEIIRKNREPVKISYIILEYAKNRDLEQYVRFPKSGFGESFSKIIFYRIAKAIHALHQKETCHRDIKLDNILLDDNFHPKLSDFGLATHNSENLEDSVGTPGYLAPEITEGREYNGFKVDIFSLGVTLFRLTLGVFPFTDSQGENSIYNLIKKKYNDLYWKYISIKENSNEAINNLSDEFKKLYNKMVSSEPSERPLIEDVLYDDWFGVIKDMSEDALDDYEKEIKLEDEFKKRAKIIEDCISSNCEQKEQKNINRTRGIDDEMNTYFENELKLKLIEKEKYMNYLINIKGYINPKNFLNILCNKIKDEFSDCLVNNINQDKAKFDVEFEEEEKEFVIPDELKGEFDKLKIKMNEKKEEKEDNDNNNLIIRIKLYQTSEGYLLRFVKKQGNKNDFIDKFETISNLAKDII